MPHPRLIRIPARLSNADLMRRLPRNVNFRDRTGEEHKGCEVLGYAGILKPDSSAWLCRCDCGKLFLARAANLNHATTGCGCRKSTHRLSQTHIYWTWRQMVHQCHNPNNRSFAGYGGRGISVCRRWRESPEQFAKDMGPRPSANHVLDRIRKGGDFTPANCRWVTRKEKLTNSAKLVIEHKGERLSVNEWARRLGMSRHAIAYRVQRCRALGASISEAVTTPKGGRLPCVAARMGRRDAPRAAAGNTRGRASKST